MIHITTILHPTDFSPSAGAALQHAASWAHRFGATLHLLHSLSAFGPCQIDDVTEQIESESPGDPTARQAVQKLKETAEKAWLGDLPVRRFLAHSAQPIDAILAHAGATQANLIVMGTQGHHTEAQPYLGSVGAAVMQRATCPVLFVHGTQEAPHDAVPNGRILVHIDLSQQTCELLELAGALAAHFQANLDLVYVAKAPRLQATGDSANLDARLKQRLMHLCSKASALEEMAASSTIDVRFHVRAGYAPDVLAAFAREHRSDVIMIVAPGLSSAGYAPLEESAEHIVLQAPCPVLTTNPLGTSPMERVVIEPAQPVTAADHSRI